jgi:hypothetical protein
VESTLEIGSAYQRFYHPLRSVIQYQILLLETDKKTSFEGEDLSIAAGAFLKSKKKTLLIEPEARNINLYAHVRG